VEGVVWCGVASASQPASQTESVSCLCICDVMWCACCPVQRMTRTRRGTRPWLRECGRERVSERVWVSQSVVHSQKGRQSGGPEVLICIE